MAGFLIFSGLLTGFIQINIDNKIKADTSDMSVNAYVLDLNKNIGFTESLINIDGNNQQNLPILDIKNKKLKNVNAIKLDQKTVVIKGFNESVDNSLLLNTLDLKAVSLKNSVNLDNLGNGSNINESIVPVTIDIALDDYVVELSNDNENEITEYEVVSGDTLSSIADKYNISVDTILWANDLNSKSSIKVGQKLVILPVSGISYKVKSGDTVSSLAKRFNVTERDIVDFNKTHDNKLIIGENIIIPGGKINNKVVDDKKTSDSTKDKNITNGTGSFARPIAGGIKTQGLHGYNGIDIGAPVGTSVFASLDGVVTLVRGGDAWNGGYGNYIVIKHKNGVQTLYAHLDSILVSKGQNVSKGQTIGKSGNTGRSTGPHLHFEVRGARNPF